MPNAFLEGKPQPFGYEIRYEAIFEEKNEAWLVVFFPYGNMGGK